MLLPAGGDAASELALEAGAAAAGKGGLRRKISRAMSLERAALRKLKMDADSTVEGGYHSIGRKTVRRKNEGR